MPQLHFFTYINYFYVLGLYMFVYYSSLQFDLILRIMDYTRIEVELRTYYYKLFFIINTGIDTLRYFYVIGVFRHLVTGKK
jgi:hypothetical protein